MVDKYYGFLLADKVVLIEANEPTDIIWENRQITKNWRKRV